MPSFEENIRNRNAVLKEVAGWSDNTPPTPLPRPVPNRTSESATSQALNNAQSAADRALKGMGQ